MYQTDRLNFYFENNFITITTMDFREFDIYVDRMSELFHITQHTYKFKYEN